ncbi:MAG: class I SAM-dependent methyltransferase [Verrucomicrobiota bacterium]
MNIHSKDRLLPEIRLPFEIITATTGLGDLATNGFLGYEDLRVTNSPNYRWTLSAHADSRIELLIIEPVYVHAFINGTAEFCGGIKFIVDGVDLALLLDPHESGPPLLLEPGLHILDARGIQSTRYCHSGWGFDTIPKSPRDPEFNVAVGAICKEVNAAFRRWIDHHLNIGVEHFFLVDLGSEESVAEAVRTAGLQEHVTVDRISDPAILGKCDPSHYLCRRFGASCNWMAMIGTSDYIIPKVSQSLPRMLSAFVDFGGLKVQQLVFGFINHPAVSSDPVATYPDCCEEDGFRVIVQPRYVLEIGSQAQVRTMAGRPVVGERFNSELSALHIQVNHYRTISMTDRVRQIAPAKNKGSCGPNSEILDDGLGHYAYSDFSAEKLIKVLASTPSGASSRAVTGFIHVAAVNHWRSILHSQIRKIRESGLEEIVDSIKIGIVGGEVGIEEEIRNLSQKIEIVVHSQDLLQFEFPTLLALQLHCEKYDGDVFYMHSKGVVNVRTDQHAWRSRMEEFLIIHHQLVREKLFEGYVAAGAFGDANPWWDVPGTNQHFPGNFWWARADHIQALPDIRHLNWNDRGDAERWIGYSEIDSFYCLDSGDTRFPSFRIVTSKVGAGRVATNGFNGWQTSRVLVKQEWLCDVIISAHAPSSLTLEVHEKIKVFGFMSGSCEPLDWIVGFSVDGQLVGQGYSALERTAVVELSKGIHVLDVLLLAGSKWGSHSCWGIDCSQDSRHAECDMGRACGTLPNHSENGGRSLYFSGSWNKRSGIINDLIRVCGFKSYLEIGLGEGSNFESIEVPHKQSVDPGLEFPQLTKPTFQLTSDEFFKNNNETYDLIFIGGLHHADQLERDIENSLKALNSTGLIVCHDISPATREQQMVPRIQDSWTGDAWKAWIAIRLRYPDLAAVVVDEDSGVGILIPGAKSGPNLDIPMDVNLNWENLVMNRRRWLNLMSSADAKQFVISRLRS